MTAPDSLTPETADPSPESVAGCPGLERFFGPGARRLEGGVLDLGPAHGSNLERYATVTHRVRFADLLRDTRAGDGVLVPDAPVVAGVTGGDPRPFDLVLAWRIFDELSERTAAALISRLAAAVRPGGHLHLVAGTEVEAPRAQPLARSGAAISRIATGSAPEPRRRLSPAEAERRIAPFRIEHSVLLRRGERELVATR